MKRHPEFTEYFISHEGKVFRNGKELKPFKHPQGYWTMVFCQDGKRKQILVHRMVAELYLPNPNNYPVVNHLDENKRNNNVNNLEWTTLEKNNEYSFAKYYVVENVNTGEKYNVYNLAKWCRERNLTANTLGTTFEGKKNKTHKGYRVIEKSEVKITH